MSRSAGRTVSIARAATATPIAPTGPRPAVELTDAKARHRSAATTVPADATIAGPALAHGDAHRLVLVLVRDQLLAVTGGEEEGVVRARAEHEDEQDPGGLAVDHDSSVGEQRGEARTSPSARNTAASGRIQKIGLR